MVTKALLFKTWYPHAFRTVEKLFHYVKTSQAMNTADLITKQFNRATDPGRVETNANSIRSLSKFQTYISS